MDTKDLNAKIKSMEEEIIALTNEIEDFEDNSMARKLEDLLSGEDPSVVRAKEEIRKKKNRVQDLKRQVKKLEVEKLKGLRKNLESKNTLED